MSRNPERCSWSELARDLGSMPRPEVPPGLALRTRNMVMRELERRAEQRWNDVMMAVLALFCWTIGFTVWALYQTFQGGIRALLDVDLVRAMGWLSVSTLAAWLTAGLAAAILARNKRLTGRRSWAA